MKEDSMNIFDLPVFPAADVFPMMADDELQELAADIAENGLREPIVIAEIPDDDGVLITTLVDGRNRRTACNIAQIEPETRQLNGEDPKAFVLSANIHRRHMTKGQRAMAVAKIYPEPRRGVHSEFRNGTGEITKARLSNARTVLTYAPDLADNVLSGAASLDDAYRIARERKTDTESDENRLADLRQRFPELADKVVEGELTLAGARAEADERESRERTQRANVFSHLGKVIILALAIPNEEFVEKYVEKINDYPDEFQDHERYTVDDLISACEQLSKILPMLESSLKRNVK